MSNAYNHRALGEGGILSGYPAMHEILARWLVQVTIILSCCRVLALCGTYMHQPKVIFEIIGGVILGPSAIGRDPESPYNLKIFPEKSLGYLSIVANVGLVLYLFIVGLELDPKLLVSHAKKTSGIAIIGMAVPFAFGAAISQIMFDTLQADEAEYANVPIVSFTVFIGTAMSITAFPVLARILKEGGLIYTVPGAMTMGAAAINDAIAWCLLILAISIANAGDLRVAGYVFGSVCCFALGLFIIVRPILEKIVIYIESLNSKPHDNNLFAFTIILVFLSAWTTALLGVHAIFGGFLLGLIVPRESRLFHACNEHIEEFVLTICLPIYFTLSGLQTDVTTIRSNAEGGMVILVCFVATAGKFIGAGGAALLSGMSIRESSTIAVLMNTRGLVELIVLNLGREAGVLNIRTFSVMVIMCLFTTFLTCPLIECIYPAHLRIKGSIDGHSQDYKEVEGGDESNATEGVESQVDLSKIAKDTRIAVVVDQSEHLQGIMDLVACFSPLSDGSQLNITAVHFIEPTHTTKDEFLGLDEEGRLLKVEEELTDIAEVINEKIDTKLVKHSHELLPLSMFCRAVGASVSAFRVQGNPEEFPKELKSLTNDFACEFSIMPWRPSYYMQKLFWGCVKTAVAPIVLVAQLSVEVPTVPEGHRSRSGSMHVPPAADGGGHRRMSIESRSSRRRKSSDNNGSVSGSFDKSTANGSSSGPFPPDPSPNHDDLLQASDIDIVVGKHAVNKVLAVLTGRPMDIAILPILLRFSERNSLKIVVMVPSDHKDFPQVNVDTYVSFKKAAATLDNITIQPLDIPSTDLEGLFRKAVSCTNDLFLCSFIDPSSMPIVVSADAMPAAAPVSSRNRSQSVSEAMAAAISFAVIEPEREEMMLKLGCPPHIASSSLTHPELGVLGSLLYDAGKTSSFICIVHEPVVLSKSKRLSVTTSRSPVSSVTTHEISVEMTNTL